VHPRPALGDLRVGTLSKYLGSLGGFVAGPRPFIDLLVNRARPFVFTTASSPADTAAGLAAVGVLRTTEGAALVERLRANVEAVAPGHPSPIVPVMIGSEYAAMAASSTTGGVGTNTLTPNGADVSSWVRSIAARSAAGDRYPAAT